MATQTEPNQLASPANVDSTSAPNSRPRNVINQSVSLTKILQHKLSRSRWHVSTIALTTTIGCTLLLLISLGFWQLDRAEQKRQIRLQQNETSSVIGNNNLANWQAVEGHHLALKGNLLPERTLLLDNKTHQGQAGYHVLVPLRLLPSGQLLLLNRGWIAAGKSRNTLPAIPAIQKQDIYLGLTHRLDKPAPLLNANNWRDSSMPPRIQNLDQIQLQALLGEPILPFSLRLTSTNANIPPTQTLVQKWQVNAISESRHRAYALQWFALALVLLTGALKVFYARSQEDPHESNTTK